MYIMYIAVYSVRLQRLMFVLYPSRLGQENASTILRKKYRRLVGSMVSGTLTWSLTCPLVAGMEWVAVYPQRPSSDHYENVSPLVMAYTAPPPCQSVAILRGKKYDARDVSMREE